MYTCIYFGRVFLVFLFFFTTTACAPVDRFYNVCVSLLRETIYKGKKTMGMKSDSIMVEDQEVFERKSEKKIPLESESTITQEYISEQILQNHSHRIPSIAFFYTPSNGLEIVFTPIYFEKDMVVPNSLEAQTTISNITKYLLESPSTSVYVEGHTDQSNSERYNLSLGEKRAKEIKKLITLKGIEESRIFTVSYGKEYLLESSSPPSNWSKNRRVTFKIHEKSSD